MVAYGGKSEVDIHGVRQYVSQQPVLHSTLGGCPTGLPNRPGRILPGATAELATLPHGGPFEERREAPRVSTPEYAASLCAPVGTGSM